MKKVILISLLLVVIGLAFGQETWEYSFDLKGNLNQSFYTDNWDGAEKSSINWVVSGEMRAKKQLTDWFKSDNSLLMKFGQLYETEEDESGMQEAGWQEPTKSDDEIDLNALGLFTLHGWVDPFVALRLQTVFEGKRLRAFNPATVTESFGISREIVKTKCMEWNSRLGLAMKQQHMYQKTTRNDGGVELVTDFGYVFPNKTTKFSSSFEAYKAVFNSLEDDINDDLDPDNDDDWKQVDMKWTNELSMQIYKNINFNVYTEWKYDKEIDKTGRFKQTSGLGISYKLF